MTVAHSQNILTATRARAVLRIIRQADQLRVASPQGKHILTSVQHALGWFCLRKTIPPASEQMLQRRLGPELHACKVVFAWVHKTAALPFGKPTQVEGHHLCLLVRQGK